VRRGENEVDFAGGRLQQARGRQGQEPRCWARLQSRESALLRRAEGLLRFQGLWYRGQAAGIRAGIRAREVASSPRAYLVREGRQVSRQGTVFVRAELQPGQDRSATGGEESSRRRSLLPQIVALEAAERVSGVSGDQVLVQRERGARDAGAGQRSRGLLRKVSVHSI